MGPLEIGALIIIGIIMFGPEKLPELARKAGRVVNFVRQIASDTTGRLREELGPEYADLQITDLHPRNLVQKHVIDPALRGETAPVEKGLPVPSPEASASPMQAPAAAQATTGFLGLYAGTKSAAATALPAESAASVAHYDTEAT